MPSKAASSFEENQKDLDRLAEIHGDYAGGERGRKFGLEVLNKAGIVFVTACWESYVEDVVVEASEFLIDAWGTNGLAVAAGSQIWIYSGGLVH